MQDKDTVEVVHEALIRHWQLLRGWMTEDRAFRVWQEHIRVDQKEWLLKQRDDGLLLRGARLLEAEENFAQFALVEKLGVQSILATQNPSPSNGYYGQALLLAL